MTFPIEKTVFLDFETRHGAAETDIKAAGTYRYASAASAIIMTWAIGDGPVECIYDIEGLSWEDFPDELKVAFGDPTMTFVAWHASFDRAVWNYAVYDSPRLEPQRTACAMAQAMAANLPASLGLAAQRLGYITGADNTQKDKAGKKLISLFCAPDGPGPEDLPELWEQFLDYACDDIASMRDIWKYTQALSVEDWQCYWANERLNERGILVDLPYVRNAAALVEQELLRINSRLQAITGGAIRTVNQHVVIAQWVYRRLPDEVSRDYMVTALPDLDDDEDELGEGDGVDVIQLPKISIDRNIVIRLLAYLADMGSDDAVLMEVLELREYGAGNAMKKFKAMLRQEVGSRLRGQIVFNGAGQTGRFSGKGVQPQNLTRVALGENDGDDYGTWEGPTVELISDGCTLEELDAFGRQDMVTARKLSLVVRPAIIAPDGKTLIKGDYAQVEARTMPWLSDSEPGEIRLDAFRAVDRDPSAPDVYTVTASGMFGVPVEEVTKEQRGGGKIGDLACQFAGGKGALMSMGLKYRLHFSDERAQYLVDRWRASNPWAPLYWGRHTDQESYGLWGAAMRAYENPGVAQKAGRVWLLYVSGYLGGSLVMFLPSGRMLTYPYCKERQHDRKDKLGRVIDSRYTLTYLRPDGMRRLYGGLLGENATQATAADLLRLSITEIDQARYLELVMHAHDEVVAEIDDTPESIALAEAHMREIMLSDREWNEGLPLAVDITPRWYYSSAKLMKKAA